MAHQNDSDVKSMDKSASYLDDSIPDINADVYFAMNMCRLDIARDFLAFNLPEKIKARVELSTLALAPQAYLSAALRKKAADMVYTVKLKGTEDELGFLIVHIEQQTNPKRLMPLRMLSFMMTIMSQYTEKQTGQDSVPIPVVIPIILSNHTSSYPYSVRFLDLFTQAGQSIVSEFLNGDLPLVDLASTPDDALKQHLKAAVMEIALKNVKKRGLEHIVMHCSEVLLFLVGLGDMDGETAGMLLQELIYFLADNLREVPTADELNRVLTSAKAALPPETGEAIMTLRDLFEAKGVERGMQQGMQQGVQRVIENMSLKGISDAQICDYVGISDAELQTYKSRSFDEESY